MLAIINNTLVQNIEVKTQIIGKEFLYAQFKYLI